MDIEEIIKENENEENNFINQDDYYKEPTIEDIRKNHLRSNYKSFEDIMTENKFIFNFLRTTIQILKKENELFSKKNIRRKGHYELYNKEQEELIINTYSKGRSEYNLRNYTFKIVKDLQKTITKAIKKEYRIIKKQEERELFLKEINDILLQMKSKIQKFL